MAVPNKPMGGSLPKGVIIKILVTGGAGFIGSHIVDAFIADGHEVVIIDNLSTGKRENLNPEAEFYECDIGSQAACDVIVNERPEILVHHAAQIDVRISVANPIEDIKTNVVGLVNLLECAKDNGLNKVIVASSGGAIYGEQSAFPADETHPTWPISPYGLNKLMSEKYLYYYQVQYGIPYVALRYANVYGPRQNCQGEAGVVAVFINKMLNGEQPIINGDGKQTRDYVYVSDVVEANRLALKATSSNKLPLPKGEGWGEGMCAEKAYNVGTAVETDVNEIFRELKELTGAEVDEKHGPAKKGEQARSVIISSRFKKEFNWTPQVKFADGLKKTVEWFQR